MPKWTEEQSAAIYTTGCDILVAAAAGSGKTAVLVERVINKIVNPFQPIDIDKLLVVTFTNAAAFEMRQRIAEALSSKLVENPLDAHMQKQLILLNNAYITTIHSFCLDVIRQNFNLLGLDPYFRIGDEVEISLIQSQILENLFEELYSLEDNEWFLSLIESYGGNIRDLKLEKLVIKVYEFIQSHPYPEEWLNANVELFNISDTASLDDTVWANICREYVKTQLLGTLESCDRAIELIHTTGGPHHYDAALQSDRIQIQYALSRTDSSFYEMYCAVDQIKFLDLSRKKSANVIISLRESVKKIRDDNIKKVIISLKEYLFFKDPSHMLADIKNLYPILKSLAKVVFLFDSKFKQYKKDNLLVDFNDLEHFCLNVLYDSNKNITPVAKELSSRFEEILIDEYQDSNLVQELILLAVSRKRYDKPNRFMVGDVKQSIYKFRQSNPELFMEKYNTFSKEGLEVRIDLFKNFRSRKEILAGINFIFRQLMSKQVGEIVYDDKAALNPSANYPDNNNGECVSNDIEVYLLDLKSQQDQHSNDDPIDDELKAISSIELEAKFVGMRILQLINSDTQIYDKEYGYRKICYKDIVVLLRTTSDWDATFAYELIKSGIPAFTNSTTGFFDTIEIMTMVSLLSIIDNPRQDIHLITVLRSPIFSFSADELVSIRYNFDKGTFFDSMNQFVAEADDTLLASKSSDFLIILKSWRKLSAYSSIVDLIWTIYKDTDYMSIVGAMLGGSVRQANLRMLVEKAATFESSSFNGLFNFILFIEKIKKTNNDIGEAKLLNQNEDVVKIMSIHKSKGLEFPIVFVSGLGKLFNLQDLQNSILLHQGLGLGTDYIDYTNRVKYTTITKSALSIKIKQESLSEELRILYVALTRASEKLILTGTVKNLEKKAVDWCSFNTFTHLQLPVFYMINARSPLDWIMPALCRHKDGHVIRDIAQLTDINISEIYKDEAIFNINVITKDDINSYEAEDSEKHVINDLRNWQADKKYSDFKDDINVRFNWQYKYKNILNIPSNISISEIKRRFQMELVNDYGVVELNSYGLNKYPKELNRRKNFKVPTFMKDSLEITRSEIGTAFHTVLQHLDFKQPQTVTTIKTLLESLLLKGLISDQQKEKINIYSILKFMNSDIANRIKAANKIYKEVPFVYGISPNEVYFDVESDEVILVHGIIDLFFIENNQIILVDYKTDFVNTSSIDNIRDKYSIQIEIYKKALERITGKNVSEALLYLFSINQTLSM